MDREFDSQHVLEEIVDRGLDYVVPKRKQTSEKAKTKQMERFSMSSLVKRRGLHLGANEWHETSLIYVQKRNWNRELKEGHERYAVLIMSLSKPTTALVEGDSHRWDLESGYKSIKWFMAATTSKSFVLRFFYSRSPGCYIRSGGWLTCSFRWISSRSTTDRRW